MSASKILIIEDDQDTARVVAKRLKQNGFDTLWAMDGYEGVKLAHSQKPDLIILDLMLPAGGGLSVLRNIRASSETRSIPVIVLTGAKAEEYKQKVAEFDVDAYLEKPYEPDALISAVEKVLQRGGN